MKIRVQGTEIAILKRNNNEYISLTDMIKAKDGSFFISDWLRNRNTVEFMGIWERINNKHFNYGEFALIKSQAGLNSYKISAKDWIEKTRAVGLISKPGRYGGTFAHKDIAIEFGMWISAEFKIYLIREFQRLKDEETQRLITGWNIKRQLTKINYRIHTDAIKERLVPKSISQKQVKIVYASEADVLNMALYGKTAQQWREKNKSKGGNMRDYSDVTQLVVLTNLESMNAELIRQGLSQPDRLVELNRVAIYQMKSLLDNPSVNRLEKKLL